MRKLPAAALRLTLLVEPAAVTSVPLPSSVAEAPLAVKLPVTVTVPLPPSTGLMPASVRLASVVGTGELTRRLAPSTDRLGGSVMAPSRESSQAFALASVSAGSAMLPVVVTSSEPPVTLAAGTLKAPVPLTVSVLPPSVIVRLLVAKSPGLLTVSRPPPLMLKGSSVVDPAPLSVTTVLAPLTARLLPPAGLDAADSVRVPPANSMPVPAASA